MNVFYLYVVNKHLAVSLPYRPLYELCPWVEATRYQVYNAPPHIDAGFTRKFNFREGWSDQINVNDLSESTRNKIIKTQEILKVYHLYLNYENSCKMRYVPIGYGADLMHRLLEEDDRLLEAYANMNNSTIEATKIELELRKQEIINLFIFLCEVKKKILDHIKKEEYQLATEYIVNEAARLHL